MNQDKPSRLYLFVAGIISVFVLMWLSDLHENLSAIITYIGWLIPVAFFYGAFTGE